MQRRKHQEQQTQEFFSNGTASVISPSGKLHKDHRQAGKRKSSAGYFVFGQIVVTGCFLGTMFCIIHWLTGIYMGAETYPSMLLSSSSSRNDRKGGKISDETMEVVKDLDLRNLKDKVIDNIDSKFPSYIVAEYAHKNDKVGVYGRPFAPGSPYAKSSFHGGWIIEGEFSDTLEYNKAMNNVTKNNWILHTYPNEVMYRKKLTEADSNEADKKKKPLFIFHVGPGKTGTT